MNLHKCYETIELNPSLNSITYFHILYLSHYNLLLIINQLHLEEMTNKKRTKKCVELDFQKGVKKINMNLFYKLKTPEQNIIED